MNDIDVTKLLEKLINSTKENTISWEYLDSNKNVCNGLGYEAVSPAKSLSTLELVASLGYSKKLFDSDNSFITEVNKNYIILYCNLDNKNGEKTLDERLIFMLVPRTYKDVFMYSSDGTDGTLLRLHSLVKSLFPNAKDIANDILNL